MGPDQRVGVRNCDHALDLRIRSGRRRRASALWMPRKRVCGIRFACHVGGNALTACGPFRPQDLSTSDSDLIHSGWRERGSRGPSRKAIRTDLTGGQLGRSRRSQG